MKRHDESLDFPCRHDQCCGSPACIRRPRRPRIQVDADNIDATIARWSTHLTGNELSAGHALLHALRELQHVALSNENGEPL